MKKAVNIIVTGRVQGVSFRYYTQKKALSLGLTGWVKNLPDYDKVEIWAEGEIDKLHELIEWVHKGPTLAHVIDVKVVWYDELKNYDDFKIRY